MVSAKILKYFPALVLTTEGKTLVVYLGILEVILKVTMLNPIADGLLLSLAAKLFCCFLFAPVPWIHQEGEVQAGELFFTSA